MKNIVLVVQMQSNVSFELVGRWNMSFVSVLNFSLFRVTLFENLLRKDHIFLL